MDTLNIRKKANNLFWLGVLAIGVEDHDTGYIEAVLEYGQVDVESKVLCAGLFDEVHIILHELIRKNGRQVNLGAHNDVILLRLGQNALNNLSPILNRRQLSVDNTHLSAEDLKAQTMCDLEVIDQLLSGFFQRHVSVLIESCVDPMAIFDGFNAILIAQILPLCHVLL